MKRFDFIYDTSKQVDFSFLYEHEKGLDHHVQELVGATSYREQSPALLIAALRGTVLVLWCIICEVKFLDRNAAYKDTALKVRRNLEFMSNCEHGQQSNG